MKIQTHKSRHMSCVHSASDNIMFVVENTLHYRFQDSCLSILICSWWIRVMKYSWPYNFVSNVLCDVIYIKPVKGFEIRDIDLSVPKIYETRCRGCTGRGAPSRPRPNPRPAGASLRPRFARPRPSPALVRRSTSNERRRHMHTQ